MKNFKQIYKDVNESIKVSDDFAKRTAEKVFKEECIPSLPAKRVLVVLVAVMLLAALFTGTVYAIGQFRKVNLSETPQFSSATDVYAEKVNRSVEHDGLTMTLSEALYENGRLYVTFNRQGEKYADALAVMPAGYGDLLIDGTRISCTGIGTCSDYSGNTLYTIEYVLEDLNLENTHDFTVGFDCAEVMLKDGSIVTVSGPWEYSFTLNVSTLDSETVIYHIGRELELSNGDTLIIDKLVCTPLSQRIYYTVNTDKNNGFASSTRLYAVDAKETCRFEFIEMNDNNGQSVNIYPDNFDTDAERISLSVTVTDRYDNVLLAPTDILCEKQN